MRDLAPFASDLLIRLDAEQGRLPELGALEPRYRTDTCIEAAADLAETVVGYHDVRCGVTSVREHALRVAVLAVQVWLATKAQDPWRAPDGDGVQTEGEEDEDGDGGC